MDKIKVIELQPTINDLKCCGNCIHYEDEMCIILALDKECYNSCKTKWKLNEKCKNK